MSESEEGAVVKRKRNGNEKVQKVKKQRSDKDHTDNSLVNGGSKLDETGADKLETKKRKKEKKQENVAGLRETAGDSEVKEEPRHADKRSKKKKGKGGQAEQDALEKDEVANSRDETAGAAEQASLLKEKEKKRAKKKEKREKKEQPHGVRNEQNGATVGHPEHGRAAKGGAVVTETDKSDEALGVSVAGAGSVDVEPYTSFDQAKVAKNIMDCCKDFQRPSPIQAHSWPFLLAGRDLIGIAATGSGKTLAFGVPALDHVLKKGISQKRPLCLVLAPTRELCQQIAEVLEHAGRACGVKTACIYGGAPKGPQRTALKSGAVIVIATPGRLQDLVEEGCCPLDMVSFVVLDEADRMLDLGFEPAIRAIVGRTSKNRQTLMFSATWPLAVDQLGKEFMKDPSPIKVTVGSQGLAANHDVTQIVQVVDAGVRDSQLESLLRQYHKSRTNRVLVFVLYKKEAARVEEFLQRRGWKVGAVHGDKGQSDRNRAVASFKDGTCPLLVATDVAARGLDIPDVECVINYSFPLTTEDYVHRIGRTGRAGKKGIAHTFFTFADRARAGELVNVLKEAGQDIPQDLLKFGTHVKKKESKLYGAHFKEITADAPKASKITFDSDSD